MLPKLIIFIIATGCVFSENKQQITYLMRSHDLKRSLSLYDKHREEHQKHDFEILEQLAHILLDEGAFSPDEEKRLLSLYGLGIGGISSSNNILHILEKGITSHSPQTQLIALQYLSQLQDDKSETLLSKAMNSDFLPIRLEAAGQLCNRKERSALGQIEALMQKLPRQFRLYFPEFFFKLGTPEATAIARHFINDRDIQVRIATILHAASHNRDDMLSSIRLAATQGVEAEREAALSALGYIQDSHSLPLLKQASESLSSTISLAALRSLYLIGETDVRGKIETIAREKNLFAITMLGEMKESDSVLSELLQDSNLQVKFNSAFALLKLKNPNCAAVLSEVLIRDLRDLGFQPYFSNGASLSSLKIVPSAKQHKKSDFFDLTAISLKIREEVLKECIELPEPYFLNIATQIFSSRQTELIPMLISLLENLQSPGAIQLLKAQSQKVGSPLIRNYCNLALFRLREEGPYEERLYEWLYSKKKNEIIQFRPLSGRVGNRKETVFELTPEENSRLIIESFTALAERHDDKGIDALLFALKEGHEKNRPILAGLLLKAIQ